MSLLLYSTRSKLILGFLAVALVVCGVALAVGGRMLYQAFMHEASNRVRMDLNAAREIYDSRVRVVRSACALASTGPVLQSAIRGRDLEAVLARLGDVAAEAELDFMGVVAGDGRILCRLGPHSLPPAGERPNPLARLALEKRTAVAGTVVLDAQTLFRENPDLARRARLGVEPGGAGGEEGRVITSGMALGAAVPIFAAGRLAGVLYGGVLLNGNREIVDRVRDTVFQHEVYRGRSVGASTIFLDDIRIATNVLGPDGSRALGTAASGEVSRAVLAGGKRWTDRAFVVNDWYITAYEPVEDIFGRRVGMLYAGVLEARYADVRRKALRVFTGVTAAGMLLALALGTVIAGRISRPVHRLIEASAEVSRGNLAPDIGPLSRSEIGVLQRTFREMLESLRRRDEARKAESETRLLEFEKQASIGKLAGGVAHEINNPLTGIFTFTHMLLRREDLDPEIRADLELVARETERVRKIVKGLLDFSRQTEIAPEPTDVNGLCRSTLALVENQALIKGVRLGFEPGEDLPSVTLDRNQMQGVLLNLVLNALDATEPGGEVALSAGIGMSAGSPRRKGVSIVCSDTGCGIPPEHLDKIFDPFFTTKDVGQGTGLGLSVSYGVVERHGGSIHVRSKAGRGSSFTVWLPVEPAREAESVV